MGSLQLYNATKRFGERKILQEVSFEIKKGEILGLFGRNGSGKSTLLKMMFGTLQADTISMCVNNEKVEANQIITQQIIGYLPQHPFLPKNVRVRDIIPIYHTSEKAQDRIFYDPHIATMTAKKAGELSLGELKYFEVVMLGNLNHPFLFLDEPFSMLEPLHKVQLKAYLITLKQRKGIVVTDHYYDDVLDISDKNLVLKDGIAHTANTVSDLQKFEYLSV